MRTLQGTVTLLFIVTNTVWHCVILLLAAIARGLVPQRQKSAISAWMDRHVMDPWVTGNRRWFEWLKTCDVKVTWDDQHELNRDRWVMVVSNHQTWTDIMLLQTRLRPVLPPVKFFTKQQLIWVPFLGLAMYALGFPYVRRVSREAREKNPELKNLDRDNTLAACEGFRTHPTTVLNFLEGTRFTPEKHARQDDPKYTHLLNPRLGGLGFVLQGMKDQLHCLVDVTIVYPNGVPTFWDFLKGECSEAHMHIATRSIDAPLMEEATQRDQLPEWVAGIWQEKDQRIQQLL